MASQAADLARCLARDAEAVCRRYLSNGRRRGRYWVVGDVANAPGCSLYVRLTGPDSGKGAAGKWTDAATGQHGDLLDLIALNQGLDHLRDVLDEARCFLSLPSPEPPPNRFRRQPPAPMGSPESARRLFAMAQPILETIAEAYLRNRGITALHDAAALRFHPRCYYRPDIDAATEIWPALIAAVTDLSGTITGAHRTWLDPSARDKAPVDTPRRAMGHLLGNGVRFGVATDVMAAGEGIETMLSVRSALPDLPMVAALSSSGSRCDASMSCATTIGPATSQWRRSPNGRSRPASRRSRCRRRWGISTRICAAWASTTFERPCASSSPRKTSPNT
jgi:hypothetical protein